jgi:gas vesicle protein
MLAASLTVLVVVSAFVAFGSWPGEGSAKQVDQVILNEVAKPKPQAVAVRADAVKVARTAELNKAVRARTQDGNRSGTAGVRTPAGSKPGTTVTGNGTGTVAPSAGNTGAQLPSVSNTAGSVQQQAQDVTRNVTQNLTQTTKDVGTTVQQQADQVTTQVNQVVDQVVKTVPAPVQAPVEQVGTTVQQVTTGVTNATGGLLGH